MEDKKPAKKKKRPVEQGETMQEYEHRLRADAMKLKGSNIKSEIAKKELGYVWVKCEATKSWKQQKIN